ncbi:pyrophosphate--fructose 6-phosphate 1-phosphotransferase subunit alpha-like isoform X2 [Carya illinoinensis]|uniref:Uncharacterized protein n=1 Tax=Carya illinoinensis TaxID=32201 RepID=A0A922EJU0_CARIL|nr:pyrophosphate--fructose 6-phosphate 1-phosphotransferase subunit alpha-like isoform X2 [Carya illinoinensis]KAG6703275.1 hypothetical protein I3842_07G075900 [Carya illinoinensis]
MIRSQQTQEPSPAPKFLFKDSGSSNHFHTKKSSLILKGVLMDDLYQNSSFSQLDEPDPKEKTMDVLTKDLDYMEKIKELQGYLDMVKKIAKPGCSEEVLNVALSSMSSLVNLLSSMSSRSKTLASL